MSWKSLDPRTGAEVPYPLDIEAQIESAFDAGVSEFRFKLSGMQFNILFSTMEQINEYGGARTVLRVPIGGAPISLASGGSPSPSVWVSFDPLTGAETPYSESDSSVIEQAYQQKQRECCVNVHGARFRVVFAQMQQINSRGGSRQVARKPRVSGAGVHPPSLPPPPRPPGYQQPIASSSTIAAATRVSSCDLSEIEIDAALVAITLADHAICELEKHEADSSFALPSGAFGDCAPVVRVYSAILAGLQEAEVRVRDGYEEHADGCLMELALGEPVPRYYANVQDVHSIWHRKALSVLGLRNLVLAGHEIFEEMRAARFCSRSDMYRGLQGPVKMERLTGNVVDLDTVVFRCTDPGCKSVVNALRAKEGLSTTEDPVEISRLPETQMMAFQAAQTCIRDFCRRLQLDDRAAAARNIDLRTVVKGGSSAPTMASQLNIPVAAGNTDRGQHPLWLYRNNGQVSFHANVPAMNEVYGALLRAPFHLATAFCLLLRRTTAGSAERRASLLEFFDKCVSDSCFNGKWKSIEQFIGELETTDNIDAAISALQAKASDVFTQAFVAADPTGKKELAETQRLVREAGLEAVGASGVRRAVTDADVVAWHQRNMAVL